jgi:hypothetical protein
MAKTPRRRTSHPESRLFRRCRGGGSPRDRRLLQFFTDWGLAGIEEGFDPLAFSADGHCRESLEPLPFRNFRFCRQPVGHHPKLIRRNVAAPDAVQQVRPEVPWQILSPNPRHTYTP